MVTTVFRMFRSFAVQAKYQSAVIVFGLVTFIAAYHYARIFNSWVDAYDYSTGSPKLTGVPFNDTYRYTEWLLTVLLPLFEILLVMKLGEAVIGIYPTLTTNDYLEAYKENVYLLMQPCLGGELFDIYSEHSELFGSERHWLIAGAGR